MFSETVVQGGFEKQTNKQRDRITEGETNGATN